MKKIANLKNAVRSLPRRGQHNAVKILCLGFGLAVGAVMIAEVYYEQTFDTWFPGHERTYVVCETIIRDGEYKEYPKTSGGVAHGLRQACPQIEAATRITPISSDAHVMIDNREYKFASIPIADSCFFDVFPQKAVEGDLKQGLAEPLHCVVSRSVAEWIGGSVVGKAIRYNEDVLTISGVYEDFPYGSSFHGTDILLSLNTFRRYDFINMWVGADRFQSYVRLAKGAAPADLKQGVERMMAAHPEYKEAGKAGVEMGYSFRLMSDAYAQSPQVRKMCWIMSMMAFALLFSTMMNYLLIMMGNMVVRFREMAVRKCYGAGRADIQAIIIAETVVHVFLGIAVAALLLFVCRGTVEQVISAPLHVIIFNGSSWILALVCVVIIIVGGVLPGGFFARVPVASAFRSMREGRRRWKPVLLAVEFAVAGMLAALLLVVHSQYTLMVNDKPGYDYAGLAVLTINNSGTDERQKAIDELRRMPEVAGVSWCTDLPISYHSGNNIYLPGDDKEYFNIADQYWTGDGYFELMGIGIVKGRGFTQHSDSLREVMVDERFVEKMKMAAKWDGNIIGRRIRVTEHSESLHPYHTICGVYRNHRLGSIINTEKRPSVMFYSSKPVGGNLLVKLHDASPAVRSAIEGRIAKLVPGHEVLVTDYRFYIDDKYRAQHSFRTGVMMCSVAILVIALAGLIGYTTDEVNRRRKEIAIRKVNGAKLADVLGLFIRGIVVIALPALIAGAACAYFVAGQWLQLFSDRIELSPLYFAGSVAVLLAVVLGVVVAGCRKVAGSNPVEYLKDND